MKLEMLRIFCIIFVLSISLFITSCALHPVVTRPVPVSHLKHYNHYSRNVKKIIVRASTLSKEHLSYIFGADNPKEGGMDCSGVIYYMLKSIKNTYVPRDSYQMYLWLLHNKKIHSVTTNHFHSYQFNALKPGDLLFWTGTYRTYRKPPITHVMLYLGKNKNGVPLMFGSSDVGIYHNEEMNGVSVFDFILPGNNRGPIRFVAYGCIPGFTC